MELAELIGLLHDIGRFEQIKRYNTFIDKNSINHGQLGVKILFDDNQIRRFIKDSKYDDIIKTAILNHNRSPKNMEFKNEKEQLHSMIIRDADKIDILYLLTFEEKKEAWEKQDLSSDIISDEIYREFMEDKNINYKEIRTSADILVSHFAYVFDFNYKCSLAIVKEKQYFDKIYERFVFNNQKTQEEYDNIYQNVKQYIERQV